VENPAKRIFHGICDIISEPLRTWHWTVPRAGDRQNVYYGRAERGDWTDVVGMDVPAETPESPDLVLENYSDLDVVMWLPATSVTGSFSAPTIPDLTFRTNRNLRSNRPSNREDD
jgi:hypothetical protein